MLGNDVEDTPVETSPDNHLQLHQLATGNIEITTVEGMNKLDTIIDISPNLKLEIKFQPQSASLKSIFGKISYCSRRS